MTETAYHLIADNPALTFDKQGDLVIPANLITQVRVGEVYSWLFDNVQLILIPQISDATLSLSNIMTQLGGPRKPDARWNSLKELRKCRERNTH